MKRLGVAEHVLCHAANSALGVGVAGAPRTEHALREEGKCLLEEHVDEDFA